MEKIVEKVASSNFGYLVFIALAIWGGTVNYLSAIKKDKNRRFSFVELVGEWTISGFAGLLTAYICIEFEFTWEWTAFCTGIAGHLGGRAIYMFEIYVEQKFFSVTKKHLKKPEDKGSNEK